MQEDIPNERQDASPMEVEQPAEKPQQHSEAPPVPPPGAELFERKTGKKRQPPSPAYTSPAFRVQDIKKHVTAEGVAKGVNKAVAPAVGYATAPPAMTIVRPNAVDNKTAPTPKLAQVARKTSKPSPATLMLKSTSAVLSGAIPSSTKPRYSKSSTSKKKRSSGSSKSAPSCVLSKAVEKAAAKKREEKLKQMKATKASERRRMS